MLHAKLYLYTDYQSAPVWAANPAHFAELTGRHERTTGVRPHRVMHANQNIPAGYRATTEKGLAGDVVERVPTMRDFVRALSPR